MSASVSEATRLLARLRSGDASAGDDLFQLVYEELRGIAGGLMKRGADGATLQPTALVHEAYLKLVDRESGLSFQDRAHFLRVAARAMRCVLVDHARSRRVRGRAQEVHGESSVDDLIGVLQDSGTDLIDLSAALERLETIDPELVRIVELRSWHDLLRGGGGPAFTPRTDAEPELCHENRKGLQNRRAPYANGPPA